jgi:hypothetical protein
MLHEPEQDQRTLARPQTITMPIECKDNHGAELCRRGPLEVLNATLHVNLIA